MKKVIIIAILLIAGLPLFAQGKSAIVVTQRPVQEIQRDLKLERVTIDRSHRLQSFLNERDKAKLYRISRELLKHLASTTKTVDLYPLAKNKVEIKFPRISKNQSDLLCFYVLVEVARTLGNQAELKQTLYSMGKISEMDALRLQMLMDRRSKFITTLSNIMKKISSTQDTLIQNLK